MTRRDARRMVVVVLLIWSRQRDQRRSELRYQASRRERLSRCGANPGTGKSGFELFVGGHGRAVRNHGNCRLTAQRGRCRTIVSRIYAVTGRGAGDLSAVVAPTEGDPRPTLPGLVLHVSRLVELFVVIDAVGKAVRPDRGAKSSYLRRKEARGHAGENNARAQAMNFRHAKAAGVAGNFRAVPLDGKRNRGIAEHAE